MRIIFFFNDTATTEIYTLSLHDALPISRLAGWLRTTVRRECLETLRRTGRERPSDPHSAEPVAAAASEDRKSTRLNSSHANISYAVFCLKKKIKIFTHASMYVPSFSLLS